MRRIFGGFLGSKETPEDAVQDLCNELCSTGVSAEVWEQVISFDSLEDELENEPRREKLAACMAQCPDNVFSLIVRCVESIQVETAKKADEFDDEAENRLGNCLVVLSYLFAAMPAATQGSEQEDAKAATETTNAAFLERLWAVRENGERPLGEVVADLLMQSLFLDNFTVDEPDTSEDSEAPEMVDGVMPALIWADGVGPEGSSQPSDEGMQANRVLVLQLLVSFLCGGAPASPLLEVTAGDDTTLSADARLSRLVILDPRPMSYISDPSRTIPFRAELLYSLISVALGYDPHGYGVPYGGYFAGAKQEAFAQLCLQVLGLLFQDVRDSLASSGDLQLSKFILVKRPQELVSQSKAIPEEEGAPRHFFRELLASITSEREVGFLVEGVITLLGTVSKERSSYLPSSVRLPPFLPEVLILVLNLTACPKFVAGACEEEELFSLIEGVLQAASQTPEFVCELTLSLVEMTILLNLTAYREVCVELDEDFEGDLPDNLPDFEGSGADLVALAVLTQVSEALGKCKASKYHQNMIEVGLSTLVNLSSFADSLCIEVTSRMFSIFERLAKPSQVKRGRGGASAFLPLMLEAFDNALQYRYANNTNLAYGLMTRQAVFRELASAVRQIQHEETALDSARDAEGASKWLQDLQVHLGAIAGLLDVTVPMLEAEVEKNEISNSEDAKELLPRCILGLMPPPHAFQMRCLQRCAPLHIACEHVLTSAIGNGPLEPLWEEEDSAASSSDDRGRLAKDESSGKQQPRKGDARERSSSRPKRERSSSRQKGGSSTKAPSKVKAPPVQQPAADARVALSAREDTVVANGHSDTAEAATPAETVAVTEPEAPAEGAEAAAKLQAQLQAAAAAGIDVNVLMQQLAAAQAVPDASKT
eukprot:TRINITY_DN43262_c0_g1_i1.p1 TRINITY_DN43262_c0_g1~~TRINITY_DN43262_c0_g1_i1.p1  ORF type:complete len:882 (+),score=230.34 TRINITY_DN43262_c0_g1_i1:104-2749(+)